VHALLRKEGCLVPGELLEPIQGVQVWTKATATEDQQPVIVGKSKFAAHAPAVVGRRNIGVRVDAAPHNRHLEAAAGIVRSKEIPIFLRHREDVRKERGGLGFDLTNAVYEALPPLTYVLEQRVAPGAMDTFGQTWVDQHGGVLNNWGLTEYIGRDISPEFPALGPDMRSRMHSMLFIEPSDLGVYTASKGYTPADICVALNRSHAASHAFWVYLGNNNTSRPWANWSNVLATINTCPLVNTDYPQIYP